MLIGLRLGRCLTSIVLALLSIGPALHAQTEATVRWGQWRGPLATGEAKSADPPIAWSEAENVAWKIEVPGIGHSTPIVWANHIFLTTAVPVGEPKAHGAASAHGAHDNVAPLRELEFTVLAVDRRDGKVAWELVVARGQPVASAHRTGSWASASPVTDGDSLIASFGSSGVFGLDLDGELLWEKDLGALEIKHGHGEGSSPALAEGLVVLNQDHEGNSFLVALDAHTGLEKWRVTRAEGTSWSTPLIVEQDARHQVIVSATHRVRGYDLLSGKALWECGGLSGNVVASPVAANGLVFVANSYESREMLAIRLAGARGDLTGTSHVAWTRHRDTPYVPSPLIHDGRLYFLKHYQGLLTAVDAASGRSLYGPVRLPGIRNVYASPIAAGGRIYIVDRNGATVVVSAGDHFEVLATNRLDDSFSASPVAVASQLILRGQQYLYSLEHRPDTGTAARPGSLSP